MQNAVKQFIKDYLPPVLIRHIRKGKNIYFFGSFASWDAAKRHSSSYNNDTILEKCKDASLKVKSGKAVYERDSVLFDKIQYSFPVLAGLLRAAIANGGNLSVLDFGGSLGSSYHQCRDFLRELKSLRWSIVEQPKFVECGKELFESEELKFYYDMDECLINEKPDVVLLSSVLPYIECPYDLLEDIVTRNFQYVILDRTPVIELESDILTVQKVPKEIYEASYPAWFLSEKKLLTCFDKHYKVLSDFDSFEVWRLGSIKAQNKGYIFLNSNAG